jgi:regulator of sirC expression with transglutaminase-like and TPR domain
MADALRVDLRSNAAAAAIKLGEWDTAVQACGAVLESEPTHAKALYRRATAYEATGESAKARADLTALLLAQPSNAAAKKLLAALPQPEPVLV